MTVDFTAYAGDTLNVVVRLFDELGAPWNIEGLDATYIIHDESANETLVTKTSVDDEIESVGNEVRIYLAAGDTNTLRGTYYHELRLVDTDGQVSTVLTGHISLDGTVL